MFVEIKIQARQQRRVGVFIDIVFQHRGIKHSSGRLLDGLAHLGRAEIDECGPVGYPKLVILHEPDLLPVLLHGHGRQCRVVCGQRHQGYILGDKRIRLRQVKRLGINRSFPGRELFGGERLPRVGHLVIGRHLVGFHTHVGERNHGIARRDLLQQAIDHDLVVAVHDIGAAQHVPRGVIVHTGSGRTDVTDRVARRLEAKTEIGQPGLLIVEPLLRPLLPQHVHIGEKELHYALVIRHTLLGQ